MTLSHPAMRAVTARLWAGRCHPRLPRPRRPAHRALAAVDELRRDPRRHRAVAARDAGRIAAARHAHPAARARASPDLHCRDEHRRSSTPARSAGIHASRTRLSPGHDRPLRDRLARHRRLRHPPRPRAHVLPDRLARASRPSSPASVITIAKVWDVVIDPIIGALTDRDLARHGTPPPAHADRRARAAGALRADLRRAAGARPGRRRRSGCSSRSPRPRPRSASSRCRTSPCPPSSPRATTSARACSPGGSSC